MLSTQPDNESSSSQSPCSPLLNAGLYALLIAALILQITGVLGRLGNFSSLAYWGAIPYLLCVALGLIYFTAFVISEVPKTPSLYRTETTLIAGISLLCITLSLLFCFLPVTARDALIYHLYLPEQWLKSNRIAPEPWHTWSYFPLLGSIGFAELISFFPNQSVQFYHWIFYALTCVLAFATSRLLGVSKKASFLASIVLATTPLSLRVAGEGMVDWITAFYLGGSFYLAILYSQFSAKIGYLVFSALFLGLALSTKYTALLAGFLITLFVIINLIREEKLIFQAFLKIALFIGVLLLAYSPWWLANFLLTGDPIYPFLMGEKSSSFSKAFVGSFNPLTYRHLHYGESWFEIFLLPLRMILGGHDGHTRSFDGVLSPLYLLVPLALFKNRSWMMLSTIGIVACHVVLAPFMHHFVTRYHLPLAVPIGVSLAYSFDLLLGLRKYGRALCAALLSGHLLLTSFYLFNQVVERELIPYLEGNLDDREYLRRHVSETLIADHIEALTPPSARLYLLFTGNRYQLYHREVRGTYFSAEPIKAELQKEDFIGGLKELFSSMGISHIVVHEYFLQQALTLEDLEKWQSFLNLSCTELPPLGVIKIFKINGGG